MKNKTKLSPKAMLKFYLRRERQGDNSLLSFKTGYSESHISNVKHGRRNAPTLLTQVMYEVASSR